MEVDNIFEELLLLRFVSLKQIDRLREIIYGEIVSLGLHTARQQAGRAHKEGGEGIQETRSNSHLPCGEATKAQRTSLCIDLWDDFTEEQEQKRQDDRLEDEA